MAVLAVENLQVEFSTYGGHVQAVRGVNLKVESGKTLAIVGESGSGKSVTFQSILGLIPCPPGKIKQGKVYFNGIDLLRASEKEMATLRGKEIAMIFQDPMTSLNPTMTVFNQIAEVLKAHQTLNKAEIKQRVLELLYKVQISEPQKRMHQYPFEFSGGMRQRVMIAIALACEPTLLIADEPTTALDVSIQAQILHLLKEIQQEEKMAMVLITHDLGVVAKMADEVVIMYAGRVVEKGSVDDVFYNPLHPYNLGLKQSMPQRADVKKPLFPIEGSPPDLFSPPQGCAYHPRCPYAMKQCALEPPAWKQKSDGHGTECWLQVKGAKKPKEISTLSG